MKNLNIGLLIVGNEILSGRTLEINLPALARLLAQKGLRIDEAAVVRDRPEDIARALRRMAEACDYVFTSGGIGPTHDDVTAAGVALAFDAEVEENREAADILAEFYRRRGLELTAARRLMARAPVGAEALRSDFDGAPGFVMRNVFICAGVPKIFEQMAAAALARLPDFPRRHSATLRADAPESEMALALADVQKRWPQIDIGSYPRDDNGYYCHLVFGGADKDAVLAAMQATSDFLQKQNIPHRQVGEEKSED